MENEIKLTFPSDETLFSVMEEEWLKSCVTVLEKKTETYENRYLDTPSRYLSGTRSTMRIRHVVGSNYIQTVKTRGGLDMRTGLSSHYEWNRRTDDRDFDIDAFLSPVKDQEDPVEYAASVLIPLKDKEIVEICRTEFTRTTYFVRFNSSEMEICLDSGKCLGGGKSLPICEMEIELTSGKVEDIKKLGELVRMHTSVEYSKLSKLARCLSLLSEVRS